MNKTGFDNAKYLEMQSAKILERIEMFGDKLYLEFGGKLFDDYHASRVLPGFEPDSKIKMLSQLKDKAEILISINADHIQKNKQRSDLGITYDTEVLRLIDIFRTNGFYVGSVVLTCFQSQPSAETFRKRLENLGIKVYRHYPIEGYPHDVDKIVSDDGYGKNEYVPTTRPLVVVTAPGPGSGKMATCLSQLYHEYKRGVKSGYAKYETFPIWNLPLNHPVNLAYEAATADLNDMNMIDPFHLEAYGKMTVNYNRDVEIFPVLDAIFKGIYGDDSPYFSPTDMGVNMVGNCIVDEDGVCDASKREIVRRYYDALCAYRDDDNERNYNAVQKIELLMQQAGISKDYRKVIAAAKAKSAETGVPAAAIELPDGRIITGKSTDMLESVSAMILNALKAITSIPDEIHLLAPEVIEPVRKLKCQYLSRTYKKLNVNEILIALSISAHTSATAAHVLKHLPNLAGCDIHSTVMLSSADVEVLKKLGLNVTCEPKYQIKEIFIG